MISLVVNGKPASIDGPMALLEFLQRREVNPNIIAVELNGEIVRRADYAGVMLQEGDRLEIVRMVGGGASPPKTRACRKPPDRFIG